MKIVVAPNAFKDSLTAEKAANAIKKGIIKALPKAEVVIKPVADGGDGVAKVLADNFKGKYITAEVNDPLFRKIKSEYVYLEEKNTAVIEMARASGLALLKNKERNVLKTSTYGTGELIKKALDRNIENLIIGIGGSATNDGGMGMAAALGAMFLDKTGNSLQPIGENLGKINKIDLRGMDKRLNQVKIEVVCDVDNPLCGEKGAAKVFAAQKGADEKTIENLDLGLRNLAEIVKKQWEIDILEMPGAGAAGGLGGGMVAFTKAVLRPGVDVILDMIEIDKEIKNAQLVITAEGQIDFQTEYGKGPAGVAKRAKKYGVPCFAVAGSINGDITNLYDIGLMAAVSLCDKPMTLEYAIENAEELVAKVSEQIIRIFAIGK